MEDVGESLRREYQPSADEFSTDDEAQSRGSVDQMPIILDTDYSMSMPNYDNLTGSHDVDKSSLKSRSSSDSLGPVTPHDSFTGNPDRRYVYIPEKGVEIPLSYDELKPLPIKRKDEGEGEKHTLHHRKEAPILDIGTLKEGQRNDVPVPLRSARASSPYAYSGNSGKSTFSGDYLLSPEVSSPDMRFSTSPKNPRYGPMKVNNDSASTESHHRAMSSSSASGFVRPNVGRHVSAIGYPGEPLPNSPIRRKPRQYDYSSSESTSDSDGSLKSRRSKRKSDQSLPHSARPPQTFTPQFHDLPLRDMKAYDSHIRPASPGSRDRPTPSQTFPIQVTETQRPDLPPRGSTIDGAFSKKPVLPLRQSTVSFLSPGHADLKREEFDRALASRRTRPPSRPVSPVSSTSQPYVSPNLAPSKDMPSVGQRSPDGPRSRQSSPLASPNPNHPPSASSTKIEPPPPLPTRIARHPTSPPELLIRPRKRESSASSYLTPSSPSRPPGIDHARRALSTTGARQDLLTPVHEQSSRRASDLPYSPVLDPKIASPRIAAPPLSPRKPRELPPCPRPNYVSGYNDWYTLAGSKDFDICPTCREAIFESGYGGHFVPSPPKQYGSETKCDFSVPWVRMAWLLTMKKNMPHVNLLYDIANIMTREPPCPGKIGAVRTWYSVFDPETGREVNNFDACPWCVRHVETLFPALKGVFTTRYSDGSSPLRTCDLRTDSKRFAAYADMLEEIHNQAIEYRRPPNMGLFIMQARTFTRRRECPRDDQMINWPWYFMPQLPEFSVCEECFHEVVRPLIDDGSPLAAQLRTMGLLPPLPGGGGVSCQLYSKRMRDVFRDACWRNDYHVLRAAASQRFSVERDLQGRLAILRAGGRGREVGEEIERLVEEWKRWE